MLPVAHFDPGRLGLDGDPYEQLELLRGHGPLVLLESGFVAAVGYDTAEAVLRSPAMTSSPIGERYRHALPEGAARDELSHRINFLDPPDHPRVRGLVSRAFTPRRIDGMRPFTERTARSLLDGLATADGPVDLQAAYAHQVPSLVISELLGVPAADRDRLTALADAVTPLLGIGLDAADRAAAIAAAEEMHAYLGALLDERRRHPAGDLLSALVTVEEDGERLSRAELLSLAATLYSAGHRTTRDLTTNGLSVLLGRPSLVDDVRSGRIPVTSVISEFLRYETPTLYVSRIPAADVALPGGTVRAGAPILVFLGAANRDPAAYERADDFEPARWGDDPPPQPPLSFAAGPHYCLGASLARMEASVMVGELLARFPSVRLTGDRVWRQRGPFRSLDGLPVLLR